MQTSKPARRRSAKGSRRLPWRHILVPIDFSKLSLSALNVAVPLARDQGARLWLLAVVEPATYVAGVESTAIAVQTAESQRNADVRLQEIAEQEVPPTVKVSRLVQRGRACEVITRLAQEKGMDLIVLTTHSRTGVDRFLMGSTAERVVRHAPCPVYVVRPIRRRTR